MRSFIALGFLLAPGLALANLITFDEFGTQPSTFDAATPVNDRYLSQGVRFRGPGGSTELGGDMLNDSTFTVKAHSGNNFLALTTGMGPEQLTFTSAQTQVSIYAASVDTSKGGSFTLTAFDSSGNQVGTNSVQLAVDVWGMLSVNAPSISKVTLTETSGAFTYVYDDVTFSPVPEPSSIAALTLGALVLIGRRRKSRSLGFGFFFT